MHDVILALLGLAVTNTIQAAPETEAIPSAYRDMIQSDIRDRLDDPESARWRWPRIRDGVGYCGWLDFRDASGDYTGLQPFYVMGAPDHDSYRVGMILLSQEGPGVADRVRATCAGLGFDIESPPSE